jgi:predicted phosphodiesterase
LAETVATIAGNVDRLIHEAPDEELMRNATLRLLYRISGLYRLLGTEVCLRQGHSMKRFLCHGTPFSDTTYLLEDASSTHPAVSPEERIGELLGPVKEAMVLCGHSHIPRVLRLSNGQLIISTRERWPSRI